MGDEGLGAGVVLDQADEGGDGVGPGDGQQLVDFGPVEAQHGLRVAGGIGVAGQAHFGQGEDVHVAGGGLRQVIGDLLQVLGDGGLFALIWTRAMRVMEHLRGKDTCAACRRQAARMPGRGYLLEVGADFAGGTPGRLCNVCTAQETNPVV